MCRRQHAVIEQINRLFTFVVGLAVVLVALGAWLRQPRRRDLLLLSSALVAGIPAQGIVGAIVVWTDLNPVAVQLHFVLSMVLVAIAVVLVIRSCEPDDAERVTVVVPRTRHRVRLMVVWTALAILAGTVVTATGPHAGDEEARRLTFLSITWATRIHSGVVWIAVLMALSLLWHLRRRAHDREVLDAPLTLWFCVAIAQGAVGYLQYANGVPAALVAVHVAVGDHAVGYVGVVVVLDVESHRDGAEHDCRLAVRRTPATISRRDSGRTRRACRSRRRRTSRLN